MTVWVVQYRETGAIRGVYEHADNIPDVFMDDDEHYLILNWVVK